MGAWATSPCPRWGIVASKKLPMAAAPVFFDAPHGRPVDVERLRAGDTVYRLSTARRRNMDRNDPASLIFVRSTVRSTDPLDVVRANTSELLPLEDYDVLVVSFSGGKDSLACVLHLLELGVPRHKIELWHQSVDGDPRAPSRLFDWPVTEDYCRAVAAELGIAIYFQWKEGGYQAELLKVNELTKPGRFEMPNGQIGEGGGKATARNKPRTRMMFPQQSADLQTRWCSSSLKIEPADKVFTNDPRFRSGAFVIIGGERREESANRGLYAAVEKHAATTQTRKVDRWRPILDWREGDVWAIIKRHGLRPHPAYEVGFGRCSCMPCIFSNADQWATIKQIAPEIFEKIGALESVFGKTIKAGATVEQQAANGTSYLALDQNGEREAAALLAMQETYLGDVRVHPSKWKLPAGAFVRSGGPT